MAERNWTKVDSSRLDSVDFDPMSRTLYVRFPADKNGNMAVYGYANVTPEKYRDLVTAKDDPRWNHSIGRFFNNEIAGKKNDHPYSRLDSERKPEEPTAA